MRLIHTLLFMLRPNYIAEDLQLATTCLRSLEKSAYTEVVVYNQGFWDNKDVEAFLQGFALKCTVIGDGINVGTVIGRQSCFEHVWRQMPDTEMLSELHLDMIFTHQWEAPLVAYLDTHDQPLVSCGIVDKDGAMSFLETPPAPLPPLEGDMDTYLVNLRRDQVVHGFTNPCIHKSAILRATGGYNASFLTGKQAYEDDSMLLGYYYYYGTRADWKPQVCYQSVVYHHLAGQRLGMNDSVMINYGGLVRQYGATGLLHLSRLHRSPWHIRFFSEQYRIMCGKGDA